MKKIALYAEQENGKLTATSYELISKAYELKHFAKNLQDTDIQISTILVSNKIDADSIEKAYCAGSDNFVLIKNEDFAQFNQIKYAGAFLSYFHENYHNYILFPATPTGRMVAPRITTILNTGLVADCTAINFILKNNDIMLASTRPTFGSELMATILSKKQPECATIRPKTFKPDFKCNNKGKYIEFPCSISSDFKISLIDTTIEKNVKVDYSNSKVIFTAGFGLYDGKDNEYIEKLYTIAKELGVDFAVSRKLVDYGVMSNEYQIGQTGSTVTPELYVAFGVSGAIQHVSGMKNSKTIIAVNNDENAEIFKYSDYKIVADAKKIIDEIASYIKK